MSFLFPHVLEIAQPDYTRRDSTQPLRSKALYQGLIASLLTYLWLRRVIFNATPMSSRIWGTRPFRVITRRYVLSFISPQIGDSRANAFQVGCSNIPFSAPFCNDLTMTTLLLYRSFGALAEFKAILEKAKRLTIRELSRKTPDSSGAKLLIACTALRAYRHRHLGTLMRCCQGWKPIENCFEPISFECVDFQRLCQIIANLTRENLAEREAEITNLPWTETEKDNALARCRSGQRAWRHKKTCTVSQCCY